MFRRLLFDHWVSLFPLIAFITAASVYVTITWRALRMRRTEVEKFARLPLEDTAQPVADHEAR